MQGHSLADFEKKEADVMMLIDQKKKAEAGESASEASSSDADLLDPPDTGPFKTELARYTLSRKWLLSTFDVEVRMTRKACIHMEALRAL